MVVVKWSHYWLHGLSSYLDQCANVKVVEQSGNWVQIENKFVKAEKVTTYSYLGYISKRRKLSIIYT